MAVMFSPKRKSNPQNSVVNYWEVKKSVEENFDFSLLPNRKFNPNYIVKENLIFELETLGVPPETVKDLDLDTLRAKFRILRSNPDPQICRISYNETSSKEALQKIVFQLTKEQENLDGIPSLGSAEGQGNTSKGFTIFLHILNRIFQLLTYAREVGDQKLISGINEALLSAKTVFSKLVELKELSSRPASPIDEKIVNIDPTTSQISQLGGNNGDILATNLGLNTESTTRDDKLNLGSSKEGNNQQPIEKVSRPNPTILITESESNKLITNSQVNMGEPSSSGKNQTTDSFNTCLNSIQNTKMMSQTTSRQSNNATLADAHDRNTDEILSCINQENHLVSTRVSDNVTHSLLNGIYNKLSNPIEALIKQLPQNDGLSVDKLLKFIEVSLLIKERSNLDGQLLFNLLVSAAIGPLAERLDRAICEGKSFNEFHGELLHYFIPSRLISVIEREHYYRLQMPNEPLSTYILAIKNSAKLLRLNKSEEEIVNDICSGLNPEERSRLVFQNKPSSFAQLTEMSVTSQNILFADRERSKFVPNNYGQNSRNVSNRVDNVRKRCYRCNNLGHISAHCRTNLGNDNKGHNSRNSGSQNPSRENRNWDTSKITCYKCNELGHYASNCNHKKS
ncbi:uncharacterized protein LOC120352986 [Nilaparvata lugens]|uniref:uncharacterized protein LOC120352986 n=1 Tax=Nilaparvata lugens TaxID=108931 RepID=UPI00193E960C|nr:uncharacterized protein LOC120352986 [Nilaparvata lugens]